MLLLRHHPSPLRRDEIVSHGREGGGPGGLRASPAQSPRDANFLAARPRPPAPAAPNRRPHGLGRPLAPS